MQPMLTFFLLSHVYFSSTPLLDSVTAGDPPTVGDPTVRKRDCRGPQNLVFTKFSLSEFGDNSRRAVSCFRYAEMQILFINPRVIRGTHPLGLCVWCFKIVDAFVKYSPVASSQKPQKKNSDISLYRKQRDSRKNYSKN